VGEKRNLSLSQQKADIDEIKQRTGILVPVKRRPAVPAARLQRRTSTSCVYAFAGCRRNRRGLEPKP
jgi:hypothetical protein